jgi:hypothetical protein
MFQHLLGYIREKLVIESLIISRTGHYRLEITFWTSTNNVNHSSNWKMLYFPIKSSHSLLNISAVIHLDIENGNLHSNHRI